ncbi:cell wall anchor protein [Rhizobium mayense]|uniref:Cell wall anchor protein n=1 Tax=Rhizobium mayense TaxID=1312184 RepID=A0ABT7JY45_9HYPH|nr:cell wall anchor protein [Rhizobium mayense]MDL2401271.1 cell wall anchor protein [Rhizobium mayense]
MRLALIAAAAALCTLSLSGCVTTSVDNANATIQQKLTDYCPKVEAAHTAFVLVTLIANVPQSVKDAEKTAYTTAEEFCADPSSVTVQTAPQKVIDALDDINDAKAKADAAS